MTSFAGNACRGTEGVQLRSAALSTPFGLEIFRKKFGDRASAIEAKLGTYASGPRKGMTKGYIHWCKVEKGGWGNRAPFESFARMGVVRPGCSAWRICRSADSSDLIEEL